jgi:cobalt-zinc-cadmium efflux system outer membrane protein
VQQQTDALVCGRARIPIDSLPPPPPVEQLPEPKNIGHACADGVSSALQQVGCVAQELTGKERKDLGEEATQLLLKRLAVPPAVPGSEALANVDILKLKGLSPAEQDKYLAKFFPPMPPLGQDPHPGPGPDGRPLTLEDLQRLAREHSPLLREAASDVKSAEGNAWQAGMYPNPTLNLTSNMIGPNGGPLYGPGISQSIKTMGKLKLSQDMALMDLANAQVAYRRAETDVMASVRSAYFAVLIAESSMRATHALADLTEELHKIMVQRMKGGAQGPYEALQVAVFANQSRIALIQARTSYLNSWRQLATALGLSAMPPTELAGRLDQRLPRFDYEKCLARVLARHTDVITANNGIHKMRYNLRLNEVMWVPDVTLGGTVVYDATPPGPPRWLTFFTGTMPIPVWDQNLGGIKQAQGQLLRANEEPHRVRAALTASVTDAFSRLETNRFQLELYVKQMLPHQVNAFRAAVNRFARAMPGDVSFNDLIASEQNLVGVIPTYLTALGAYWQAVSDLASLLQTDNVYEMAEEVENCPLPDLAKLLSLPCCHPCATLPQPALKGVSGFESPPGRAITPEVHGVETIPQAPPAAPSLGRAVPTPDGGATVRPALLLPPVAMPGRLD